MAWWIIGTAHLKNKEQDMKGVSFGGVPDKMFAPTPNEGNRCAYEHCALGYGIAEGSAARFALVGMSNQWCHKECAEKWEMEARNAPAAEPEAKVLCGAPHPVELDEGPTCTREPHQGGNHLDGKGGGWYMEPVDVERLKAKLGVALDAAEAVVDDGEPLLAVPLNVPDPIVALSGGRDGDIVIVAYDGPTTPSGRIPASERTSVAAVVEPHPDEAVIDEAIGDAEPMLDDEVQEALKADLGQLYADVRRRSLTEQQKAELAVVVELTKILQPHGIFVTAQLLVELLEWKNG